MVGCALAVLLLSSKPVSAKPISARPASAAAQDDSIATVNGEAITRREYEGELASSMDYWRKQDPAAMSDAAKVQEVRQSVVDELINRTLLYQESKRQKIEISERKVDEAVEEIRGRFTHDDDGRALTAEQAQAGFDAQLRTEGLTFDQFRERLRKQVAVRELLEGRVKGGKQEMEAYVNSLKAQAEIVRHALPASSAPADDARGEAKTAPSKAAGKPWWQ